MNCGEAALHLGFQSPCNREDSEQAGPSGLASSSQKGSVPTYVMMLSPFLHVLILIGIGLRWVASMNTVSDLIKPHLIASINIRMKIFSNRSLSLNLLS